MGRARITDADIPSNLQGSSGVDDLFEVPKPTPGQAGRRRRLLAITFSDEAIPKRIRALAKRWEKTGPDRKSPGVSQIVEYLLLPRLEEAERGLLDPPS
jgi:hypothetical protein